MWIWEGYGIEELIGLRYIEGVEIVWCVRVCVDKAYGGWERGGRDRD